MARQHPIRDAGLAVSLLTAIPTSARWPDDGATQSAAWFPLVGAFVGSVGYALVHAADALRITPRAPLVVAALVVLAWALFTRFLHWDGLADVADGFWGSHDRERRLEIMADSHTGAFGATAVVLIGILEVSSIAAIIRMPHELPVLLVPVFARFSATAASWFGTPARPGGLGRSVMGRPTAMSLLIAGVTIVLAGALFTFGFGWLGLAFAVVGVVVALAVPHLLALRFGGVTGDVMGASVLLTEATLFAAFALAR